MEMELDKWKQEHHNLREQLQNNINKTISDNAAGSTLKPFTMGPFQTGKY